MKRLLIYDDESRRGEKYAEVLRKLKIVRSSFDVESVSNQKFEKEWEVLLDRRNRLRSGRKWNDDLLELDEASIYVIDYDLLKSLKSKSFITGELVAYLVRCFSRCGLIIGLNQYGANTFDLTLKGHPESYADLNIGSEQLDNSGLWGGQADGFRPWYWPQLPDHLKCFQRRVKDIAENPDALVCDFLGMKDAVRMLPRSVSEFIGDDPLKTTFKDFVTKSGNGLKGRDQNPTTEMTARIASARISKWLERLVLPGQDFLIDAPHLVSRFPSLLKGLHSDVNSWNKTAGFGSFKELNVDREEIEDFRFKKEHWLSRPAWFWPRLCDYQRIKEVSEPWKRESTDYVFCEDSSRFCRQRECSEFLSESDSPYNRRFVCLFTGVDYRPKVRLLESKGLKE